MEPNTPNRTPVSQDISRRLLLALRGVFARHGVQTLRVNPGHEGVLGALDGRTPVVQGLKLTWAHPEDRLRLWQAAALDGAPSEQTASEEDFYMDALVTLLNLGIGRLQFGPASEIGFFADPREAGGLGFRGEHLVLSPLPAPADSRTESRGTQVDLKW